MPDEMSRPLIRGRGEGGGSRHLEASMSEAGAPVIGILGTGDFSRSLARRLVASGYQVVVGSRNPKRSAALFPEEAEVTSQMEAASQADLVFVAVFPEHHSTLVDLKPTLAGKILVDVSNGLRINRDGPSNAEQLADLFPESSVVKGFNTISAWTLQMGPRDGSRQILLCSNNSKAKTSVMQLCRRMGFVPVDMGLLSSSLEIENLPLYLFPSWRIPVLCTLSLFIFFYTYNFLRDVLQPYVTAHKSVFYKMPIETVNVTLPSVALVMLALVYLPGVCAAFLQLWSGTKYNRFPNWLDRWLTRRKQLGLCSFLCAVLHAIYSLCLPMRKSARFKLLSSFKQVKEGEDLWIDEEVWRMELYLSVGIMALGLLSLLAVTSLPSVANTINWREFSFIQCTLGNCALSMATLHTLLFGWDRAFDPAQYRFYLPPTFILVLILPLTVLLGRLALCVPCVARRLRQIRRGWEKSRHIRFTLPDDDCRNGLEDQIPTQKKDTIAERVGQARCSNSSSKVCQFQPAVMNESFEQAVEDVKILKQRPGYGVLGEVYGLYKQATVGDVNIGRPGIFDLAGRGKWDAWERRKGLSKDEAMGAYVKLVEELKKEYGF
ncbi:metalloreductase STEAP3 isoform X2 [Sander lucioperca]|nr:metalloreductase STEAP3 isoform X2 [Sander lucioperca]XP_031147798.1 metalloreductase STEAP3 isoform X2 [Sander lucioperca]XP_031147800.1 metalloreductase STEAP3 isoform X2 [Sander lucioperca]